MAKDTWPAEQDIRECVREIRLLLKAQIIEKGLPQETFWAVVTRMFVLVITVVVESEKLAKRRIDFTDDVLIKKSVKDAASLILFGRDALCRMESENHMSDAIYCSLNVIRGKGNLGQNNKLDIKRSDYEDDIAFLIGFQRVYYRRHLLRAYNQAIKNLEQFFGRAL